MSPLSSLPSHNCLIHAMSMVIDRRVFPPQPDILEWERRKKVHRISYETFEYIIGAKMTPHPRAPLGEAQSQRASFKPHCDLLKALGLPPNSQPSGETLLNHALEKYPFEIYVGLKNWRHPQRISCTPSLREEFFYVGAPMILAKLSPFFLMPHSAIIWAIVEAPFILLALAFAPLSLLYIGAGYRMKYCAYSAEVTPRTKAICKVALYTLFFPTVPLLFDVELFHLITRLARNISTYVANKLNAMTQHNIAFFQTAHNATLEEKYAREIEQIKTVEWPRLVATAVGRVPYASLYHQDLPEKENL